MTKKAKKTDNLPLHRTGFFPLTPFNRFLFPQSMQREGRSASLLLIKPKRAGDTCVYPPFRSGGPAFAGGTGPLCALCNPPFSDARGTLTFPLSSACTTAVLKSRKAANIYLQLRG